jgi:hypothetical protein
MDRRLLSFPRLGLEVFNPSPIILRMKKQKNNWNLTPIISLGIIVAVHYANDPCEIFRSAP